MANAINSIVYGDNTYVFTIPYGSCSTAAATAAKVVSVDKFSLETGAKVAVKFTITNTASSPTLNVNSTGAKAIYYNGAAITAGYLKANKVYEFIYNGTQWDFVGDIDTNTNTDTKVTQTSSSTNGAYPLLLAYSTSPTSGTASTTYYDTGMTANPSTNTITATTFSGALSGNATTATTATKLGSSTVGGTTQPIYLSSGTATAGSTYAGGTKVTLNGSNKGASTASFYAPTSVGTSGQVLTSAGSGAPTWTAQSSLSVGSATKATQDGSGNTITSTYLPLTGGALTGALTTSSTIAVDSGQHISVGNTSYYDGYISIVGATPYIEFNYDNTDSYTSRIIESSSGTLTLSNNLAVTNNLTVGLSTSTSPQYSRVQNSLHDGSLYVSEGGNFGLFSHTNNKWAYYMNSAGTITYSPAAHFKVGTTSLTEYVTIYAQNSYHSGGIHASTAGNLGLFSSLLNKWIIRMDTNGYSYIPSTLECNGLYSDSCYYGKSYLTAPGNIYSILNNAGTDIGIVVATHFRPNVNNTMSCGTSGYLWTAVYAKTTTISSSDRNVKKDIRSFDTDENYEKFFMDLKPMVFKYIDGTSNRDHFGYISQDVEESLYKYGFDDLSFAGFCKDVRVEEVENEDGTVTEVPILDEDGNEQYDYALRYSEFISLNTYMIQKLYNKIEALEAEIEELKNA